MSLILHEETGGLTIVAEQELVLGRSEHAHGSPRIASLCNCEMARIVSLRNGDTVEPRHGFRRLWEMLDKANLLDEVHDLEAFGTKDSNLELEEDQVVRF